MVLAHLTRVGLGRALAVRNSGTDRMLGPAAAWKDVDRTAVARLSSAAWSDFRKNSMIFAAIFTIVVANRFLVGREQAA